MPVCTLATFLEFQPIISASLEMIGVILMANAYFYDSAESPFRRGTLFMKILLVALVRGELAKRSAKAALAFGEENGLSALQGLSFIALGFFLQLIAAVLNLTQ
ncbi:hypothetical protein [Teredinibacter turnerae]|uniref:hypothetical protein n=1 Tax=Teredinibacter turnerae TaxID=2426 RepID=UPI00036E8065|nr:hypothetical protein [Teredinibacter turnerae]